jgi:ankyrin repeat protein
MRKTIFSLLMLVACAGTMASTYEDLIIAANEGRTEVVVDLVRRGMDVNSVDRDGTTLLAMASRGGYVTLVDWLLGQRASVHKPNRYGDTALLMAASQGRTVVAERLLTAGAALNPEGWTPLHYAVFGGHEALTRELIRRGAQIDAYAPNRRTALMLAAQAGNLELVAMLIELGARSELTDADGLTAAQIARKKDFEEVAVRIEGTPRTKP